MKDNKQRLFEMMEKLNPSDNNIEPVKVVKNKGPLDWKKM